MLRRRAYPSPLLPIFPSLDIIFSLSPLSFYSISKRFDEEVLEDVHFLLHYGEFAGYRGRLLDMITGIVGWTPE